MQPKLRFQPTAICAVVLMIAACRGFALDPRQPASSYVRKDFTIEDGLPANEVRAIVQTQNGFLWVGTDGGLARFDGKRFAPINIRGGAAQQIPVRVLLTTPEGDLWVGTDAGLAHIRNAALDHFDRGLVTIYHVGVGSSDQILCMHWSRAGTLWVGTSGGLYRFERDKFISIIPPDMISRIEERSDGHLLIITGHGFVEWDGTRIIPHPEIAQQLGVSTNKVFHAYEDHEGVTWFCTDKGVARSVSGRLTKLEPYGSPGATAWRVYEDPHRIIWVVTKLGLFRASATSLQPVMPGLAPDFAYFDRDGDLWVSVENEGLVRFKDRAVWMYTTADGLPNNGVRTVLRSHEGTLWVGNNCGGISRFDGTRFQNYNEKDGLTNSCVWAMAEDTEHNLWIGTWGGGLYRFRDGHFTQYSERQGLPGTVVVSIVAAPDGSLWIATLSGLSHMQNGHLRNYSVADGLSSDLLTTVYQDRGGTIWVGTSAGIDRLVGDRFVTVPQDAGSSNAMFRTLREDSSGDLYAFSEVNGVSRLEHDRFVSVNETLAWRGMIESGHDLWFSGRRGIFRIAAGDLRHAGQDRESPLDYSSFDPDDGMNSRECDGWGQPNMAMTSDDNLWVATVKGLARLDLRQFQRTNYKPAIYMEEIDVGRTKASPGRELILPPSTYRVEFHFTAVDLVSPEKIRLQYRLDDVDPLWLDADSNRTAVYNSIPVGSHSFHIRACNRDGVWDRAGISFPVTQKPYFYQTGWFRLGAVVAFVLALTGGYRQRLHKIRTQMNERFNERVEERMRIGRDLHDTLLQSFQGLMLRLQAVNELLSEGKAKDQLEQTLKRADQAITEGRTALSDLRSSTATMDDLTQAVTALGNELAAKDTAAFHLVVEGRAREFHPIVRDELYRIAREALRNAFGHARAQRIEAEISYGERLFRLRIRDDGEGIAPDVLKHGRPGHYGLAGMGERARQIGAKLSTWSRAGAGTEIELSVPAYNAYMRSPKFYPRRFFRERLG